MKKILLLHTGGTFGMEPMLPDDVLAPGNLLQQIQNHAPEIAGLADVDIEVLFNEDSSNVRLQHWVKVARAIHHKIDAYDGFVIIHGTDTMVYTASAVSFALRNLKKPVVFTGAQRPLSKLRSDARLNLIDAVETATQSFGDVLIVFGQEVYRANRAKKVSISSYDAFTSPNYPMVGEIGLNLNIDQKRLFHSAKNYHFNDSFKDGVAVIPVMPQSVADTYLPFMGSENIRAFLLIGFGAGNVPENGNDGWLSFIEKAVQKNKPVFVGSHSPNGSVDLSLYESGRALTQAGAIGIKDMTLEAAYVKIMKILAENANREAKAELLYENWAGEIGE